MKVTLLLLLLLPLGFSFSEEAHGSNKKLSCAEDLMDSPLDNMSLQRAARICTKWPVAAVSCAKNLILEEQIELSLDEALSVCQSNSKPVIACAVKHQTQGAFGNVISTCSLLLKKHPIDAANEIVQKEESDDDDSNTDDDAASADSVSVAAEAQ